MKKQLPTDIANELAGSSVFFQQSAEPTQDATQEETHEIEKSQPKTTMTPRHRETTPTRQKAVEKPGHHYVGQDYSGDNVNAAALETIRKTVRQIGKEAATHRFTTEEKNVLADIVYTYTRQGYRTSENEITRIAVNWLILDYQERGEHSVLARMLEALHK